MPSSNICLGTQIEPLSQTSDNSVFDPETLVIPEYQHSKHTLQADIHTTPRLHSDNKETPKRPSKHTDDASNHSSMSFQNTFKREMESFQTFTQAMEKKFEENVILDLLLKTN